MNFQEIANKAKAFVATIEALAAEGEDFVDAHLTLHAMEADASMAIDAVDVPLQRLVAAFAKLKAGMAAHSVANAVADTPLPTAPPIDPATGAPVVHP